LPRENPGKQKSHNVKRAAGQSRKGHPMAYAGRSAKKIFGRLAHAALRPNRGVFVANLPWAGKSGPGNMPGKIRRRVCKRPLDIPWRFSYSMVNGKSAIFLARFIAVVSCR
jgi:hypothetical protein